MKLKYIPNIMSAFRIFMVPVFVYTFFRYFETIYISLSVFLIAGITDIVDGWLARRNGWITNLGKLLDPLADKLLQSSVLICFAMKNLIPWIVVAVLLSKELFMIIGAVLVLKKIKVTVKSNWYGKFATAVFYLIFFSIFIFHKQLNETGASNILLIVALVLALFSMIMYIIDTLHINKAQKDGTTVK